jgi:alanyl-tRNA synthetase
MPLEEAQALGADMFFGEKYLPDAVRVVRVDGYSKELCGGTHVSATGQIGSFRITSESSVGAGLRRIEAVTGAAAEELVERRLESLHTAATLLGDREENVAARVEALLARLRDAEKAAREPRAARGSEIDARAALESAQQAGEARVVVQHYADADAAALRALADELRGLAGRFVAVASGSGSGPALMVAASRDLTGEGFDAVRIIRAVAPLIGGGGGGRADLAQAGGKDASRLDEALREAARLALESLQRIEQP